ncbi:hypothetical protein [Paraburkholderia podalyriae]|uniref:SMODS-associating 2TM beta-strand rich effector domain-containing protein n=2 Tax=Paraburkholderia TaxID=1822464 RepID=A0ABR7PSQ8_9BURK|nr:hypothetical protein [Paraburkholderia podalyriae]MBC8749307.1 hypothetical protein [Paraburkholderia podalyriae]
MWNKIKKISKVKIKSKHNQIPEFLLFNSKTLKAVIAGRIRDVESRSGGWQGPLSIFVTLLATYLVSDFKDKFGVSAAQWAALAIFSMILTGLWTLRGLWRLTFRPSVNGFLYELYEESLTKQSRRIVFIFKAKDGDGVAKVLAYRDPVWNCYLLPNVRRSEVPDDDSKLADILHGRFGGGGSGCFVVTNIEDCELVSNKVSRRSGRYTTYSFDFFSVVVCDKLKGRFSAKSFQVGESILYEWLSLDELSADQATVQGNGDILNFLCENSTELLGKATPLAVNVPLVGQADE